MFGTIRKHQNWLWAVIITVIIISFVIYFSPYQKMHRESGEARLGSINGEKISAEQFVRAQRDVYLRFFVMTGRWPDNEEARRLGFDLERETYQWLLLQQKADQLNIVPGHQTVEEQALRMIEPLRQVGVGSPKVFFEQVLPAKGFTAEDYERFVVNFIRVQELIATVGMSGKLVTPDEIKSLYIRENQEVSSQAVFFNASNYLANVTVTPEAIAQFYTNRSAAYRIPDRLQLSYVKFPISNFLAVAAAEIGSTNLTDLVEANYTRLGTNAIRYGATPEAAKAKIREEILSARAVPEARKKASEFASPIFDSESETNTLKPEMLEARAKEMNIPVQVSAPFSSGNLPAEFENVPDLAKVASSLGPDRPISLPIVGEDAVYVVAFKNKIPTEIPTLETIKDKVTQEYKQFQAMTAARQAGSLFHTAVTNGLAQKKTFEEIAKQSGYTPVNLPPFSLSTRALPEVDQQMNLNQLKQMAYSLDPGEVSDFQPTANGGAILYLKEKLPVDNAKMQANMATFANNVRRQRQEEAFNEWFRREADRGLRDTPLGQPRQPTPTIQSATKKS